MKKIDLTQSDPKQNAQLTIAFREEKNCYELFLEDLDSSIEVKLNPEQALVLAEYICKSNSVKEPDPFAHLNPEIIVSGSTN